MSALTAKERATALRRLRQYLPSLSDRLGPATAFLDQFLRDAEAAQHGAPLDFELHADGRCTIAGKTLPKDGRGLALAWLVLACHQTRQPPLRCDWFYEGHRRPGNNAGNALRRACAQAERISLDLASAIRAIGIEGAHLVIKHPVRGVRCTSEALARACAAV